MENTHFALPWCLWVTCGRPLCLTYQNEIQTATLVRSRNNLFDATVTGDAIFNSKLEVCANDFLVPFLFPLSSNHSHSHPFPFPLVAQNYSHSHGNSRGIPWEWEFPCNSIPMEISWETHGNGNSHSDAHLYSKCTRNYFADVLGSKRL